MFTPFFYLLKAKGLEVSLTEWLTFMEALDQGLSGASLTQFYYLGRMILVKSETDYDKYDRAFQEFFQGIKTMDEIPPQFMEWLENVEADEETMWDQENNILYRKNQEPPDEEEIRRRFQERLEEQKTRHDGGTYWIGRRGGSTFGNGGRTPGGIRINGQSGLRSAFQVIGEVPGFPAGQGVEYETV